MEPSGRWEWPHRRGRGPCARGFRWVERGHWWPTGVWARVGMRGYAWRPEQDSNLRPLAPEASALSAELSGQLGQFSRVSYIHAGR